MMSKLILIAFLIGGSNCLKEAKAVFENASIDSPQPLSMELVECVFNQEINQELTPSIQAIHMFENSNSTTFLTEYTRAWGGYHSYYMLNLVSETGSLIKSEVISETQLDENGGFVTEFQIIRDSLLEVAVQYLELDRNGKEVPTKRDYQYYLANESGFKLVNNRSANSERSFDASIRIIDYNELVRMSLDDLNVMRNEIFADHGYIFKSDKWKKYFLRTDWYQPKHEDVNDKLTVIERLNILTILRASKGK